MGTATDAGRGLGTGSGGGGTTDHNLLNNRSASNQHPTSAITGLDAALAAKADLVGGQALPAQLGTGTRNGSKFLRDDGAWADPPSGGGGGSGTLVITGNGAPTNATGSDGDLYLDLNSGAWYGPKTSGAWPVGVAERILGGDVGFSPTPYTATGGVTWYQILAYSTLPLYVQITPTDSNATWRLEYTISPLATFQSDPGSCTWVAHEGGDFSLNLQGGAPWSDVISEWLPTAIRITRTSGSGNAAVVLSSPRRAAQGIAGQLDLTISADRLNVNLFAEAGNPSSALTINCTINAGATVGSSTTSLPAIDEGPLPNGSTVNYVINGRVQGAGGRGGDAWSQNGTFAGQGGFAGGDAIKLATTTVTHNFSGSGQLWSGGGGGGGSGHNGTWGAGGGGGAGTVGGAGGRGGNGTDAIYNGLAGSAGVGGAGNAGGGSVLAGGNGGGPGQSGTAGGNGTNGSGGSGASAGNAVRGTFGGSFGSIDVRGTVGA